MALGSMRTRRKQKFIPPKLQITSMMDMFTIILIFLLFSFSSKPETITLDKGLQLPKSNAELDYKDNIRLVASQDALRLGDEVISQIKNGEILGLDEEKPETSVLYQRLKHFKEETVQKTDVDHPADEHILFLCDKRLSFKTINKIIKTAGKAGYPNFQFGVLKQ